MKLKVEPKALIEPEIQLHCARYSPCGKFLIAPGFDANVHRWNIEGEEPVALPPVNGHHAWATDIAFHPNSELIVSADSWGQLRCWKYAEENPKPLWTVDDAHDGWIRALAISPDGNTLLTCGRDQKVKLFESKTGKPIRTCEGHTEDVYAVAFHPSGKWLVSGDLRGEIIQWETGTGKKIREFEAPGLYLYHRIQDVGGVRRLTFTPDGKTLAAAGGKPATGGFVKGHARIYLFDFASEKSDELMIGKENTDVFAHDFFFHPTGSILTVTSGQPGQGSLIIHRPGEAEADLVYKTKLTNCHSISPHPDGKTIAVASTNSGSNGNGRRLVDGKYLGNNSPIHLLSLVESDA